MDLLEGLKSEIFRPLVTLFLPGAVAVGPFILLVKNRISGCDSFWKDHPVEFVAIVLISVLVAGLVIEDFGSRIESSLWDRLLKRKFKKSDEEWHAYLQLWTNDEIVGQRYLDSIVIRMKFELSMPPALVIHAIGLAWINLTNKFLNSYELTVVLVMLLGLAAYLLWESWTSAQFLVSLRQDVIAACAKHGREAGS